ncbi:MAG: hypothetical protein Q8J84_08845 [Flavobacteriaceae bacterium]|nr:hypothetical protein [Flavobacteriaceae bacterium]
MKGDLNHLLFSKEVTHKDSTKKPLFRFQSELAGEIVRLSNDYSSKTQESIRPYLNQVLKSGNSPYHKPISAEMRNAIILAIKDRLSDQKEAELLSSIDSVFDAAYDVLKQKVKVRNTQTDESEYNELLEWQGKSNRTFILNREPSEAKWLYRHKDEYSEVKDLMNLTIQNLFKNFEGNQKNICKNILENKDLKLSSTDRNKQYFYRFYVPSYTIAKEVWQGFVEYILFEVFKHEFSDKKTSELFEATCKLVSFFNDFQNTQFMRVFKVDGYLTSIPLVYFESSEGINQTENIMQHESLFSLILHEGELHSVSKITGADLDFWKEQVYYPLHWSKSKKESFNSEEIKFFDVLSHIKRTIDKTKLNSNETAS